MQKRIASREKELPQPLNKKSESNRRRGVMSISEALKTVTAAENPYANFATAVHPLICFTSFVMMTPFPSGLARAL